MTPRLRRRAVALLLMGALGCGDSEEPPRDPEPRRAAARAAPAPARRAPTAATAQLRQPERRAPTAATAQLRRPERRAPVQATAHRVTLQRLDEALLAMDPAEVVRTLEEIQGPLESAHYILQRGSEIEVDGDVRPIDGELSILHCAFLDPEDEARGREFWMGGLRLEGAPDLLDGRIETRRVLAVLGREVQYTGRWRDVREVRGGLSGFGRTLDVEIDEATPEETWVWRRELLQAESPHSQASFRGERDPCASELELHLEIEEQLEHWQLQEREGELHPVLAELERREPVARLTLVGVQVSVEPEIIDPAQRTLHARPLTTRSPDSIPHRVLSPGER